MLQADVIRVCYFEPASAGSRMVAARLFGPDATADNQRVDVDGFAARLIVADEQRLGRKRARSGAEKLLRAAGFSDPGHAYAMAMDRIIRDTRGWA